MLTNLANQADATAFGYGTIPGGFFTRASARVRAYVDQDITFGTSTLVARAPVVMLPQRPVVEVFSVTEDGVELEENNDWVLRVGGVIEIPNQSGNLEINYSHGFDPVPDQVKEVVCSIASRLSTVTPEVAAGVIQETAGTESVSFGFDSYNAISELSTGEKRMLDRLFPKRPGVVVSRP
jgi:hypothetical protein